MTCMWCCRYPGRQKVPHVLGTGATVHFHHPVERRILHVPMEWGIAQDYQHERYSQPDDQVANQHACKIRQASPFIPVERRNYVGGLMSSEIAG